jgi:hypothetical protein
MNKETGNEIKMVNFGDNNLKKEMLLLPLKISFKLFPGQKINKKLTKNLRIFLYLIHHSPDRVKNAILKMFKRVRKTESASYKNILKRKLFVA